MEVTASGGLVNTTRYYTGPDGTVVALRNNTGVTWLASGLHGSAQLAIEDSTGQIRRERYLPYGQRRGADDLPFTDRGFLGKTEDDSTGLTYLSARYYDPSIARFISTDPLLNTDKPQWLNPYSYAGDDPIGLADPEGLKPDPGCSGGDRFTAPCIEARCKGSKTDECKQWRAEIAEGKRRAQIIVDNMMFLELYKANCQGAPPSGVDMDYHLGNCAMFAQNAGLVLDGPGYQGDVWEEQHGIVKFFLEDAKACLDDSNIGSCAMLASGGVGRGVKFGLKQGIEGIKGAFKKAGDLLKKCNSFVPGTLVLMADGTRKPIEEVEVGDEVLATDPDTGETKPRPVIDLIAGVGTKTLVQITVDTDGLDGDATGVVIATDEHPFWRVDTRTWIAAAQLSAGAWLRTDSGAQVQVAATRKWTLYHQKVHNFTVAQLHTYYVGAGAADILVHNASLDWRCIKFTGAERQEFSKWANVSFNADEGGKTAAIQYHLGEHGKGRNLVEYTNRAVDLWDAYGHEKKPVKLRNGKMGWKIKIGKRFGIYTQNGKIVTYAD
ncbi:hypothetical protein MBA17_19835 [Streptosporangium sp. KLBMP 9127]|nr:hypothetical protein [Streptosporangium sp. KLBMP 9127]